MKFNFIKITIRLFMVIILINTPVCILSQSQLDSLKNNYNNLQLEYYILSILENQQKKIDSLNKSFLSNSYVKETVDEYYKDIDWYYKQVNTFVAIIGLLFTIVNITIIVIGSLGISRIKKDSEIQKTDLRENFNSLENRTNELIRNTTQIISVFDKTIEKLNNDVEKISKEMTDMFNSKKEEFNEKELTFQRNYDYLNETMHNALSIFLSRLVSIHYEDNLLKSQLQAISYRLELLSNISENRQMAVLGIAYCGDETDKSTLTDIINNKRENGDVRLAAKEAFDILTNRLEIKRKT